VERATGGTVRVEVHEGLVGIPAVGPVPEPFEEGAKAVGGSEVQL
jgi:hypothetical protein